MHRPSPLHALFLCHLPRIEAHARLALRHVRCPDARADLGSEVVALARRHFAALSRAGKRPEEFVTTLALRCSQAVRGGRRLAGGQRSRDALSPVAAARHRFAVASLSGPVLPEDIETALADGARGRVPARVAFRIDFPAWRASLSPRNRALVDALARGDGTGEVAERFGISPGRVSQMRRAFEGSWPAFHAGT